MRFLQSRLHAKLHTNHRVRFCHILLEKKRVVFTWVRVGVSMANSARAPWMAGATKRATVRNVANMLSRIVSWRGRGKMSRKEGKDNGWKM